MSHATQATTTVWNFIDRVAFALVVHRAWNTRPLLTAGNGRKFPCTLECALQPRGDAVS